MAVLMISVKTLKERTGIHDNIDEKLIYPEILNAQELFILPILGTALYNRLINDISNNALSGNYKTLVDVYLTPALSNYVVSELPIALNYQFFNKGVSVKTSDNANTPSMSELLDIANKYKNRAEAYQRKAVVYLKQHAPQLFIEYINPGTGIDTVYPDRVAFSSPIFLADERQIAKTYEEKYQGNRPIDSGNYW